jgi:2-keto-4-pentenoate hydratase/2-oxohepta-3-ene-1,7-dioic acid hydratase in catechol pathway
MPTPPRVGVLVEDTMVDLAHAWRRHYGTGQGPDSVRSYLAHEPDHRAIHAAAEELVWAGNGLLLANVRLRPPVPDPDKILCIGVNYRDHAAETGAALPTSPVVFAKFRNSLIGPDDPIVLPAITDRIDYEAELAVVIGRRGKGIPEANALEHVAEVMAFNDVTARDLQRVTSQWTLGKAIDTFAPSGPSLVTLDEVPNLSAISLRTTINGVVLQEGTTPTWCSASRS